MTPPAPPWKADGPCRDAAGLFFLFRGGRGSEEGRARPSTPEPVRESFLAVRIGTMILCPFCHFQNEDGALFCEQCKSDLSGVPESTPATRPPAQPEPVLAEPVIAEPVVAMPIDPIPAVPILEVEAVAVEAEAVVAEPFQPTPEPVMEATPIEAVPIEPEPWSPAVPMAETQAPPAPDVHEPFAPPPPPPEPPPPPPPPKVEAPPPPPAPPPAPEPPLAPVAAAPAPAPAAAAPSPAAPPADAVALPAGSEPRLLVLRGQRRNVEYPVYEGLNFIGRADEKPVDIDLEDQEPPDRIWCSRQHALISLEEGKLFLEDLNSANGTYLNRNRVYPGQKQPLKVNDVIQIGNVQLKVIV